MQIFFLVFMVTLAITMWGRKRFRKIYDQETQYLISSQVTGAQLVEKILRARGIEGVTVKRARGLLTDFYHPEKKQISLAPQHYGGATFSALGVSANLAGHAIQHFEGHKPLFWRVSAIRATVFLSLPLIILSVGALVAGMNKTVLPAMLMIWAMIALSNIITIPTELDAGERAKRQLDRIKAFKNLDERVGVERVMGASSTMYIDGFFTVLSWLGSLMVPWMKKQMEPEAE